MKAQKNIQKLCLSYAMELEMVQNYIAASVNRDGVRSQVLKKPSSFGFLNEYEQR